MKTDITFIRESIESLSPRSAFDKASKSFALDLLDKYDELCDWCDSEGKECPPFCLDTALNGARDWKEYCYGGNGLIYDTDIAEALCTPDTLKRVKNGTIPPNSRDTWMDLQVRVYYRTWNLISRYM